jgi:hypothetical protein
VHFTVKLVHHGKRYSFKVTEEPDQIFIAYTLTKKGRISEKIFLTRVAGRWSTDGGQNAMMKKLTAAIENRLKKEQPENPQSKVLT